MSYKILLQVRNGQIYIVKYFQVNAALDGLQNSKATLINKISGRRSLFNRAFLYFYL